MPAPSPDGPWADCGDGPFVCGSGYVFGRQGSEPRNAADPVAGDGDDLYVVVDATVPGTERPSGTTYGTITSGIASQGAIYFTKTENGGRTWSQLTRVDPQASGNQFFPDIDANGGQLHVMWQDSRASTARGTDGFDVMQCRAPNPDGTFGADTCPNAGGLDDNIWGFVTG